MAGRYDLVPLDTSTRNKMLGQYNQFADQAFSERDMDALLARYNTLEDQGLNQAWNAAQMEINDQFSPSFNAIRARNYGLYGEGAGINRDYGNLTQDLMGKLTGQRFSLGAETASRKAATLRALAQQRVQGRQQMSAQMWDRILNTKKKPTTGQQLGSAGLQLAGAGLGALAGGPAGAAAGSQAGSYFANPDAGFYNSQAPPLPSATKPIYSNNAYDQQLDDLRRRRGY